jgi:hypothetical protein
VQATHPQQKGDGVTTIAHADAPAVAQALIVTIGVDTHRDVHVAGARDQLGRRIGVRLIPTTPAGYQQLLDWHARWARSPRSGSRGPAATAPG